MKFDVIVGNPPFQNANGNGNFSLWSEFIEKGYDVLEDNGTMAMITPQTWAANKKVSNGKGTSKIRQNVFSKGTLNAVSFDIDNHFKGVGSTFSYWVFNKKKSDNLTLVKTPNGDYHIDYNVTLWLPIIKYDINSATPPSINFYNDGREFGGFRAGVANTVIGNSDKHIYPIANTSAQYTKNVFLMSKVKHPIQNERKVIFSRSGYSAPFYDNGKYGVGQDARAILVKDEQEANEIIQYLNSDEIKNIARTLPSTGSVSDICRLINVGFFDDNE